MAQCRPRARHRQPPCQCNEDARRISRHACNRSAIAHEGKGWRADDQPFSILSATRRKGCAHRMNKEFLLVAPAVAMLMLIAGCSGGEGVKLNPAQSPSPPPATPPPP